MQLNNDISTPSAPARAEGAQGGLPQPTVAISGGVQSLPPADTVSIAKKADAVATENRLAAASRITNHEMAAQVAEATQEKILAEPATAVSAQARQSNADVLRILEPK
jgi:threonine synthase